MEQEVFRTTFMEKYKIENNTSTDDEYMFTCDIGMSSVGRINNIIVTLQS